jgi:hypothetical protein
MFASQSAVSTKELSVVFSHANTKVSINEADLMRKILRMKQTLRGCTFWQIHSSLFLAAALEELSWSRK